jgi:transcriptional/translational regulatory protein YebC/TACO1
VTDSRNRLMQEVRLLFKDYGFALQPTGATKLHLKLRGSISVILDGKSEDDLLMQATEAGAEDVDTTVCGEEETPKWALVYTDASNVIGVKTALEEAGFPIRSFERSYFPIMPTEIDDLDAWEKVQNFANKLEDVSDSINVYHNAVPSDDLVAQLEAEEASPDAGKKRK